MYCPSIFSEKRIPVIHDLISRHSLGTWTCWVNDQLVVNHIPFVLDDRVGEFGTLSGHVAKANPIWKFVSEAAPSVVVFQGAQAYITPSWYSSKKEHGKVVPTWNYAVVHAHGCASAIHDKHWLLEHITELSDRKEAGRDTPWKVTDAPENFTKKLTNGIVGISIPIRTLEGRWKMSQNKNELDKKGVVTGLQASASGQEKEMAEMIRTQ